MGKGNTVVRRWLKNRERFADLFNGQCFDGKQIVLPEDLEPIDSESDVLITDKSGKAKEVRRYRDVVMRWKKGPVLVILGCENQAKVHYAMPVRNMIYDGLSYVEQIRQIWEQHKKENETVMTNEEFLSKFLKTDKLYPVITLVLYYGLEKWDASIDLYGMFHGDMELLKNIEPYVSNYRMNLVEAGNIEQLGNFHSDLQKIFGMLQYRDNKDALVNYMQENGTYFRNVDEETYQVIGEFLHSEHTLKKVVKRKKEDTIDMCRALEELYNDGKKQGINQKLVELITKKISKGKSVEEIAEDLEESVDIIEKIMEEMQIKNAAK